MMQKNKLLFVLAVFSFLLLSFTKNDSETYVDTGTEAILSEDEYGEKIIQALNGDLYAAYDLFEHHLSVPVNSKEEFLQQTSYWAIIAAENDTYGRNMYTLYSFNRTFNCISENRSLFWLQKSAQLKYKDSLEEIKLLKKSIKNKKDLNSLSKIFNLEEYKNSAEFGNQHAVIELLNYYKKTDNKAEIKYWLQIGAQNGNKDCMKEYAAILKQSGDEYDSIRAKFWEKKAAD